MKRKTFKQQMLEWWRDEMLGACTFGAFRQRYIELHTVVLDENALNMTIGKLMRQLGTRHYTVANKPYWILRPENMVGLRAGLHQIAEPACICGSRSILAKHDYDRVGHIKYQQMQFVVDCLGRVILYEGAKPHLSRLTEDELRELLSEFNAGHIAYVTLEQLLWCRDAKNWDYEFYAEVPHVHDDGEKYHYMLEQWV